MIYFFFACALCEVDLSDLLHLFLRGRRIGRTAKVKYSSF